MPSGACSTPKARQTIPAHLLGSVPEEKLVEPPPNIAGPLLLNLAFAQDQDELRRLYVELLAKAMQA